MKFEHKFPVGFRFSAFEVWAKFHESFRIRVLARLVVEFRLGLWGSVWCVISFAVDVLVCRTFAPELYRISA
jgi:hypothetical protein